MLGMAALLLGGCAGPAVTETPTATAAAATATATPSPTAALPSPSGSPPREVTWTPDIQAIDQQFTTPTLDYRSDGVSVLWSSGAVDGPGADHAADIWRYQPGQSEPELVFDNPDRDSALPIVVGDGTGRYAFVERNERLYGRGGWTVWYLPAVGVEPILADQSDAESDSVPFLALDQGRLAWGSRHEGPDESVSRLLLLEPGDTEPAVIAEAHAADTLFGFPALDGDRLVYATAETEDGGAEMEFHVYLRDLSAPEAEPQRLDTAGAATQPLISGDFVVWKVAPDNAFGWGGLRVHRLSTGEQFDIDPVDMHTDTDLSFNQASIGERFVAAHDPNHNSLYVYDLERREPVLIEDLGEDRNEGEREAVVGRPHLDGDLLAYIQGSDDPSVELVLKYVELPPAGSVARGDR